jgi:thioredoxin-related protein
MFAITNQGEFLQDVSKQNKVLLVFLRHFGCMFCRETLSELVEKRKEIEEQGYRIVIVHMGTESYAAQILEVYDLEDVARISDPDQELYETFGLKRLSLFTFLHPKVLLRAILAMIKGHLPGKVKDDPFQMPGLFVYYQGRIHKRLDNKLPSEEFDYLKFLEIPA